MRRRSLIATVAGATLAGCFQNGESDDTSDESEPPSDDGFGEVDDTESLVETAEEYAQLTFEDGWEQQFTNVFDGASETTTTSRSDIPFRVFWPADEFYGTTMDHMFESEYGYEPDAAYLRTWMQFPDGWEFDSEGLGGTKLPGFASRFNGADADDQGGWGGREADGTNGWSARMFNCRPDRHPDGAGPIALGTQLYHAEADSEYGDHPRWKHPLETGTWHRIDQYVELNTPGESDGTYLGWVDGELAIALDDLYMRDVGHEDIKIESVWFNCYFGGDWGSPVDQHMHFDDLQLWLWEDRPGVTGAQA